MTRRPYMSMTVKLQAALYALGFNSTAVEWDHDPALGLRPYDEATGTYTPDANDPRHIVPRSREAHAVKTNGNHVPLSGDKSKIAKATRLTAKTEAFRARLADPDRHAQTTIRFKRKWPKRAFPKRKDRPWAP